MNVINSSPTALFSLFPTSIGTCGIAWCGDKVVATQLPEKTRADTVKRLVSRLNASEGQPPPRVRKAIASMTSLLEGERADLSYIECDFSGVDPFATEVYAATREIPAGEVKTYGGIASQLGNKQLARHVGRALGRNPLPVIVPCHRVVGANRSLTGFSAYGGVETKLKMLTIEGALIGETPDLFSEIAPVAKKQR